MRIGILSDTHGLLRPEVRRALQGCDAILHAGDIDNPKILGELSGIAPVYAVRGNNDRAWAEEIPMVLDFSLAGKRIFMAHRMGDLPGELQKYDLVIYGHSHRYDCRKDGSTLILNPGSCGPRRFRQDITFAVGEIGEGKMEIVRMELE